jgi:3-hydroxyisobutyrate dehydrogenase/putative dehydrogenase
MTTVGWIGLGAMGGPMAACVARAGHQVTAYDIDPVAVEALTGDGVAPAATAAEAAQGVDVLAVMVATPAQVDSVLFDNGAAAELTGGAVVLVMATVGPTALEGWVDRLASTGVALVDAPVSGGVARAASGDLLMMVSGPSDAVATVQPLLDAMARTAPVVGDQPGDGQKVKLVNQLLCGVHIAVAGEALAFAEALGLDAGSTWLGGRRRARALVPVATGNHCRTALPGGPPRRTRQAGRLQRHRRLARQASGAGRPRLNGPHGRVGSAVRR